MRVLSETDICFKTLQSRDNKRPNQGQTIKKQVSIDNSFSHQNICSRKWNNKFLFISFLGKNVLHLAKKTDREN